MGDNERGRTGEHGNELEARAEADGMGENPGAFFPPIPIFPHVLARFKCKFSSALLSERLETEQFVVDSLSLYTPDM